MTKIDEAVLNSIKSQSTDDAAQASTQEPICCVDHVDLD